MDAKQVELAIAKFFDIRKNLIVPNVSWGLDLHECDILIITKAGCGIEIEIKVDKYDLIRDKNKRHQHKSNKLKSLFFAVPEVLIQKFNSFEEFESHIPENVGIIFVNAVNKCKIIKKAKTNKESRKFNDNEVLHLAKLGTMRMWNLKEKLLNIGL